MAEPISAGAIAGLMALNGGLGFLGNTVSTRRQYKYQSALQLQQQNWLEKMSNSAYQRQKKDLLAAGYNPLLAVNAGGASTPASGMGQIGMADDGQSLQNSISNALAFKKTLAEIKNIEADTTSKNGTPQNILGNLINGLGGTNEITNNILNWLDDSILGQKWREYKINKESSRNEKIYKLRVEKNRILDSEQVIDKELEKQLKRLPKL